MKIAWLFLLLGMLGTAWASNPKNCTDLLSLPDQSEIKKICQYQEGECQANVWNVLDYLRRQRANLDGAKVLVLYHAPETMFSDEFFGLYPQNPRLPPGTAWLFHAVLENKGQIIDPDYADGPVRFATYFRKMFKIKPTRLDDKYRVIEIPALLYLAYFRDVDVAYQMDINIGSLRSPDESIRFLSMPLRTWFSKQVKKQYGRFKPSK